MHIDLFYMDISNILVPTSLDSNGGMNGFLCLCGEKACPPIYTFLVKRMKSITNNQML